MIIKTSIISTLILVMCSMIYAQKQLDLDTTIVIKAKYIEGDPWSILSGNVNYPIEGPKDNIQGDVIISAIITSDGKMDSIVIEDSPHIAFSISSLEALDLLNGTWAPAEYNAQPISKKYYFVFKFKSYMEIVTNNRQKANEAIQEKNYKKALRYFNKDAKDNFYNSHVFSMRSAVNQELGNIEESKNDLNYSLLLQNNVMVVVETSIIGIKRTTRTIEY